MVENTSNVPAGSHAQHKRQYPPAPPPLPPPPKRNSFLDFVSKNRINREQNEGNSQPHVAEPQLPANYAANTRRHPASIFDLRERFHSEVPILPSEQVKLKESIIAAFLDAGLDSLGKLDEIDNVKKACKYLISVSHLGLISQQRMVAIRNLEFYLDKWPAEYSKSSEILSRYGNLKHLEDSQQARADAKLNEIPDIQLSEELILSELAEAETQLLNLEKQVLEFKKFIADRKNRLASTQSQILKLCLDVQAMQMNAIKAAADQESLADEVNKAKRDRRDLEERWQNVSSVLGHSE